MDHDDPEFVKITSLFDDLEHNFTNGIAADVFPILRYFPSKVIVIIDYQAVERIRFVASVWVRGTLARRDLSVKDIGQKSRSNSDRMCFSN